MVHQGPTSHRIRCLTARVDNFDPSSGAEKYKSLRVVAAPHVVSAHPSRQGLEQGCTCAHVADAEPTARSDSVCHRAVSTAPSHQHGFPREGVRKFHPKCRGGTRVPTLTREWAPGECKTTGRTPPHVVVNTRHHTSGHRVQPRGVRRTSTATQGTNTLVKRSRRRNIAGTFTSFTLLSA